MLPAGSHLTIIAPMRVAEHTGARPSLRANLTWHLMDPATLNRWIAQAHRLGTDSLRVTLGFSDRHQTFFEDYTLSATPAITSGQAVPALEVMTNSVRLLAQDAVSEDNERVLSPVPRPLEVAIFHTARRAEDARYVRAALDAVAYRPLTVTEREATADLTVPPSLTLAFWLSPEPLPEGLRTRMGEGLTVIRDAPDAEGTSIASWISMPDDRTAKAPRLKRRVAASGAGAARWSDGFGEVLLTQDNQGEGLVFTFFSRFNPAWTDLVLHPAWPAWIATHVAPPPAPDLLSDRRMLGVNQPFPRQNTEEIALEQPPTTMPLDGLLWLVLLVLFALERWISVRQTQKQPDLVPA